MSLKDLNRMLDEQAKKKILKEKFEKMKLQGEKTTALKRKRQLMEKSVGSIPVGKMKL